MSGFRFWFVFFLSTVASADPRIESAYCREVHARAASDAWILMTPKLLAQGLRYPNVGVPDPTNAFGSGAQVRAGLIFSFSDFYKGWQLSDVAEAECERQQAELRAKEVLGSAEESLKSRALQVQAKYLLGRRQEWRDLLRREEARFEQHSVTVVELAELRVRASELERKLIQIQSAGAQLPVEVSASPESMRQAREQYLARANTLEKKSARLRALDMLQFRVTGGAAASERPSDWFALAEVTFSLGAFGQRAEERRYLAARAEELAQAPYELNGSTQDFQQKLQSARDQARAELEILDQELAAVASARNSLQSSSAQDADHAIGMLMLEEISKGAEREYLRALSETLSGLLTGEKTG